jgi:serralysin
VLSGGAGTTRWTAGGDDTLDGGPARHGELCRRASGVTVSLAVAGAQNTVGAGSDTLTGIENLTGSSFNDVLTGDAGPTC